MSDDSYTPGTDEPAPIWREAWRAFQDPFLVTPEAKHFPSPFESFVAGYIAAHDAALLASVAPADTTDDRETLAVIIYAGLYPDAAETYGDPELRAERSRARRIAGRIVAAGFRRADTEWEYGTGILETGDGTMWDYDPSDSLGSARLAADEWNANNPFADRVCVVLTRTPEIPAGPWVPVPTEREGEK